MPRTQCGRSGRSTNSSFACDSSAWVLVECLLDGWRRCEISGVDKIDSERGSRVNLAHACVKVWVPKMDALGRNWVQKCPHWIQKMSQMGLIWVIPHRGSEVERFRRSEVLLPNFECFFVVPGRAMHDFLTVLLSHCRLTQLWLLK